MAAYTRYYPSGTSAGAQLPAAWVNYIDSKLPDLVHAGGGTWAPSAAIVLGGSGVNITGPALLPDIRAGAVQTGYSFSIDSGATLNVSGTLYTDGTSVYIDGSTVTLDSGASFIVGSGTSATVQSGGTLSVASGGTANVAGDLNIQSGGDLEVASGGSIVMASGSDLTIGDITNVSAATYTKTYRYTPAVTSGLSGFTEESSFATSQYWLQGGPVGSDHFSIGLPNLGASATVTYIAAYVKGAGGHSWPIGTVPRLLFGQVSTATGAISTFAYADDTSGSAAAYDAAHTIVLNSPTLTPQSLSGVVATIQLRGESGSNALAGLEVYAIDVQVQYTAVECGG